MWEVALHFKLPARSGLEVFLAEIKQDCFLIELFEFAL